MYDELINLSVSLSSVFDDLYVYFKRDFVDTKTYLNKSIYINPRSNLKDDGKEIVFWHLVSSDQYNTVTKQKERLLDTYRAERLNWIKKIIEHYTDSSIKLFYHFEEKHNKMRLYLWAYKHDFVVILQKLGQKESYLVTSFHVSYAKKREDFEKRYQTYVSGEDKRLKNCEWF